MSHVTRFVAAVVIVASIAQGLQANEAKPPAKEVATVVEGNNQFALELYSRLRSEKSGNLFFSPYSISTAFAMTYAGARGETADRMASVLHFEKNDDVHADFDRLTSTILGGKKKGYQIHVANRLWGQAGYDFLADFLRTTKENYDAKLAQVDFVGETEASRRTINAWVEEQTNDKIKDLIPSGALNDMTRLVLANAIYFKGDWEHQFIKKTTQDAPFHVSADEQVKAPIMYQKESFKYADVEGLQVLEMPYASDDLSMIVLLPKKTDGLPALEKKLDHKNFKAWTAKLQKKKVQVYLPRFTMTSEFKLNSVLSSMGMGLAFAPGQADFSGMNGQKDLFISAALHKAFVDVNEEGTEAAAATGIAIGTTSIQITPVFRADHPFIFLIRDNRTGSILFLGRVLNPME